MKPTLRVASRAGSVVVAMLVVGGATGCSRAGKAPEPKTQSVDSSSRPVLTRPDSVTITLRYHQSTILAPPAGRGLDIHFADVSGDSRCPIGVQCVWEGDATVTLRLSLSTSATFSDTTIQLHTSPRFATTATYKNVQIHLVGLEPYPHQGMKIAPQEYTAKLIIR